MINDRDKTDDLFRNSLANMKVEPSQGLWEKIEYRFFSGMESTWFSGRILIISILIAFSGLVTWISLSGSRQNNIQTVTAAESLTQAGSFNESYNNSGRTSEINPDKISSSGKENTLNAIEENSNIKQSENPNSPRSSKKENTNSIPLIDKTAQSSGTNENDSPEAVQTMFASNTSRENPSSMENTGKLPSTIASTDRPGLAMAGQLIALPPGMLGIKESKTEKLNGRSEDYLKAFSSTFEDSYVEKADFGIGVHFTPAIVFYDPNPNRAAYSAGLSFNYQSPSGFKLQTGIGLSRMQDLGSYSVNYLSYDSVGYYMKVTSFTVDPVDPAKVILNYNREIVYDSLQHFSLTEKVNTYTYLEIPLNIGYTFFERKRLSLGLKTGIIYGLLINKNEPTVEFNGPPSEFLSIERKVPPRNKIVWRYSASLDFGYMLSEKVSFHLEPVFEQYINSIYKEDPAFKASKPFIFGLHAGILFNF
jgi:hypothetical protein